MDKIKRLRLIYLNYLKANPRAFKTLSKSCDFLFITKADVKNHTVKRQYKKAIMSNISEKHQANIIFNAIGGHDAWTKLATNALHFVTSMSHLSCRIRPNKTGSRFMIVDSVGGLRFDLTFVVDGETPDVAFKDIPKHLLPFYIEGATGIEIT